MVERTNWEEGMEKERMKEEGKNLEAKDYQMNNKLIKEVRRGWPGNRRLKNYRKSKESTKFEKIGYIHKSRRVKDTQLWKTKIETRMKIIKRTQGGNKTRKETN